MAAFEQYFSGAPPYRSRKARSDIPDAFIFGALVDLVSETEDIVHAVIRDNRLREAACNVDGVSTYCTLDELFALPEMVQAQNRLEHAARWRGWMARFSDEIPGFSHFLESEIREIAIDLLYGKEVCHPSIPDDNGCGTVTQIGEALDITFDWDRVQDLGAGFLSVPVGFDIGCLVDFYVFRMDAYSVPDGVSVSIGDFERDHFFDAQGYVSLHVVGVISFSISYDFIEAPELGEPSQVTLDGLQIEVIEDGDGSIFD